MNLHEYQAKELLRKHGCPVPEGEIARNVDEAIAAYGRLEEDRCVIKAQVYAGGRGKAGGVRIVDNKQDVVKVIKDMLGTRLVTYQTTSEGQPVNAVLIESPCEIKRELYLSALVDRSKQRIVFMASSEGGVDIESVAKDHPEKIFQFYVDPVIGAMPFQARSMAKKLGLRGGSVKEFTRLILSLSKMVEENDLSMLEINPLVLDTEGHIVCLDGKITVDDNALFRHADLRDYYDPSQEDERENIARNHQLNYIALEGNIGCMVNGAGLAMATMDLIQLCGGRPANFLDVGGGTTKERVTEAFKIILSDQQVKAIFVNIFGGIVRCDLIADGIISAIAEMDLNIAVVVRLEGNNSEIGMKKLETSDLNIISEADFHKAAEIAVEIAQKGEA